MIQPNPVEFSFSRDWIHAGVRYQSGDKASFSPATATMLAALDAGKPASQGKPSKRRLVDADGHDITALGESQ